MKSRWSRTEILGKRLHWLVEVTWAGRAIRLSIDTLTVTSTEFGALHYDGTCDPITLAEEVSLFSLSASPVSVTLNATWPVDVAVLVEQGHDLAGARCEIAQWVEGTDWEDRRVVLIGRLVDPEYGEDGWVGCSVEENLFEDRTHIPATSWVMDEDVLSNIVGGCLLGEEDKGLPYPVILGKPGNDPQAYEGWHTGSACLWITKATSTHHLLLSYGHTAATQAWLNNDDYTLGDLFNLLNGHDDAGNPVTYIDQRATGSHAAGYDGLEVVFMNFSDTFRPATTDVRTIYAGWSPGGGVKGRKGTAVRSAGEVLEYLLDHATVPVDRGRFAVAARLLERFRIDTYIDDPVSPWEWIQQELLPLLPVSLVPGPDGWYPIVWRPDATSADSVAHLDGDIDPHLQFAANVEVDTTSILNDFTLEYGQSRRTGTFDYTARLSAKYVAATNHARTRFIRVFGPLADILYVSAIAAGPAAVGTRVYLDDTGAAPPNVVDNPTTHTVQMTYQSSGATATTANLANEFQTSTIVTAGENTDTDVWNIVAIEDDDRTLTLVDNGTMPSLWCAISQARYRDQTADGSGIFPETIQTRHVWDKATSYAILQWRAAAFALARRRLSLLAPEAEWGWLERGDVVTMSYARLGIADSVALVEALEWGSDGLLGIRLALIEDPVRDRHVAG